MRKLAVLMLLLMMPGCDGQGGFSAPPSKKEAAEVIKHYLKKENYCEGVLEIKTLEVNTIELSTTMGGWKVLAKYVGTCRAKNSQLEYVIANHHDSNPYEIYIKSDGDGWYEAYMPDELKKNVNTEMKKILKKIRMH